MPANEHNAIKLAELVGVRIPEIKLVYPDRITPRLSPAYDIVTTSVYIPGERHLALNLSNTKDWYDVSLAHFQSWSEHAGIPWRAIRHHLDDVMANARDLWPTAIDDLPMHEAHRQKVREHWRNLHGDFRIG